MTSTFSYSGRASPESVTPFLLETSQPQASNKLCKLCNHTINQTAAMPHFWTTAAEEEQHRTLSSQSTLSSWQFKNLDGQEVSDQI
jgi:hypothetical protein